MFKTLFSVAFASFLSFAAAAQTTDQKIGYVDVDYVIAQLPSAIQLSEHLKTLEADLVKNYQQKELEFKTKYDEFVKAEKTMLPTLRENTVRELQALQQNLQAFGADIEKTLKDREDVLSVPIFNSIGEAIAAIGKEQGFTLILNTKAAGSPIILTGDPNSNISDLVLKKLGVTPKPPAPATTGAPATKTPAATTKAPATKPTTPVKKN
jgi:outer membrane protein